MSAFFERLRAALAPDYELQRELASGGMGTVYLARDISLDCPVAVKVMRPELWTAAAVELFVREARTLRLVRHPNIVPVHKVDERDGLHFYVMDYLSGDTLQDYLERHGSLSVPAARKLGRDLLDALEVAHKNHVIHRDVKPANLFIEQHRGVLTDFGIARRLTDEQRSDSHVRMGTAAYMAPEQFAGVEANVRTDIYAAGMVIYEALSGRRWDKTPPEDGNWSGIPLNLGRVLRRAVDLDPKRRWPDVASFRRALWHTRVWRYRRNTIGVAIGCMLLGLAIPAFLPEARTTVPIRVEAASGSGLPDWLGDSLACGFARILDRYPELSVRCVSGWSRLWGHGTRLRLEIANENGIARVRITGALAALDTIEQRGRPAEWEALAGTLGDRAFGALLNTRSALLDPSLPAAVLPKSTAGLLAFQEAEQHFARGRWGEARAAYAAAAALDSTCWLCYWRHAEVGRWFDLQDDPRDSARYVAHVEAFPVHYQSLIRAQWLPEVQRLDSLEALTRRWKDFLFGQFRRGDELLHRGPLVGRPRREAMAPFEDVLKYQPAFGPALQHVAWVHIAEGDSADAVAALGRIRPLDDPRDPSFATIALVQLAYTWRFLPRAEAARRTAELVRAAQAAGVKELDAGARYLPAFGVADGALAFGERLLGEPGFARSAGLARVLASVALGRPDTAVALARALAGRFPELTLFADELAAATLLFDLDSVRLEREWPEIRVALVGDADQPAGPADRRRRARLMLELGERAWRAHPGVGRVRPRRDVSLPSPIATLLHADDLASQGAYDSAFAATATLGGIPAQLTDDPFFRTFLHLRRAEWYEQAGRPLDARADLRWHENSDLYGYPTGDPQPAEIDWAFAPLAEWRLAGLLERTGGRAAELCRAYRTVARLWASGEARYRLRADSAQRRVAALGCKEIA